ncbi:MAG: hypothetical protein QG654_439 [Patescibacteria group bacterium]|nr:hypothetical protein [Patescibacteria group bacterium]
MKKLAWWLVIIGALNWGLIGLGSLFFGGEINLVSILLGYGVFAKIVYLLVGVSAVYVLMGHCGCKGCCGSSCKDCTNGKCETHKKV